MVAEMEATSGTPAWTPVVKTVLATAATEYPICQPQKLTLSIQYSIILSGDQPAT